VLVGLTGVIGSGKSTVLSFFAEMGWQTLDADTICHDMYKDAGCDAYTLMVNRWGKEIVSEDGSINRKRVADLVFNNSHDREWLNSVLHPAVLERAIEFYIQFDATVPVLFDVPLLFEVNWEKYFTKIIVVFISPEIQLRRLLERGMSESDIKRRIAHQMPICEKVDKADVVLINNGSLDLLREQCREENIRLNNKEDYEKR